MQLNQFYELSGLQQLILGSRYPLNSLCDQHQLLTVQGCNQ